jgi:hypothetical protein
LVVSLGKQRSVLAEKRGMCGVREYHTHLFFFDKRTSPPKEARLPLLILFWAGGTWKVERGKTVLPFSERGLSLYTRTLNEKREKPFEPFLAVGAGCSLLAEARKDTKPSPDLGGV